MRYCISLASRILVHWVMNGHTGICNQFWLSTGLTYGCATGSNMRVAEIHMELGWMEQMQLCGKHKYQSSSISKNSPRGCAVILSTNLKYRKQG